MSVSTLLEYGRLSSVRTGWGDRPHEGREVYTFFHLYWTLDFDDGKHSLYEYTTFSIYIGTLVYLGCGDGKKGMDGDVSVACRSPFLNK